MEFFQSSDQLRVQAWAARALSLTAERRGEHRSGPAELPEAVLSNGVRVRLRPATPAGGTFSVVTLETWRDAETAPADSRAEPELRGVLEWLDEGVILFDAQDNVQDGEPRSLIPELGAAVNALAEYAPIVVMGDASWSPVCRI
jgi:hypothetical protein